MIEMSENVRVLQLAVIACQDQLVAAKRELFLALEAESPFKVNDVVEAKLRDCSWVPVIIRSVAPQSWGDYWYAVSTRKKDGSWSKFEYNVFERVRVPGGPPDPELVVTPDML